MAVSSDRIQGASYPRLDCAAKMAVGAIAIFEVYFPFFPKPEGKVAVSPKPR